MKFRNIRLFSVIAAATLAGASLTGLAFAGDGGSGNNPDKGSGGSTPGNNLSFPVINPEGVPKTLRGDYGVLAHNDWFWYYWELPEVTAGPPDLEPIHGACPADPDNTSFCDDGVEGTAVGDPPPVDAVPVYPQQDEFITWQAEQADWSAAPVDVHWIDWGDALEAVDWNLRSQVRAELVLYQDLPVPMLQYEMKHLDGFGIDELWGTTGTELDGMQATVYSPCARFTIQKLLVERDDPALVALVWVPTVPATDVTELVGGHWFGEGLIDAPIFNYAIYQTGQEEDPEAYNAENNIKGKIIYGYTWNVRNLNEGAGDYRMTFSFDEVCPIADDPETPEVDESEIAYLNTYFTDGVTQIVPLEEEEVESLLDAIMEGDETNNPSGGAVPVLDFPGNLTYADVRVEVKEGGGGGSSH